MQFLYSSIHLDWRNIWFRPGWLNNNIFFRLAPPASFSSPLLLFVRVTPARDTPKKNSRRGRIQKKAFNPSKAALEESLTPLLRLVSIASDCRSVHLLKPRGKLLRQRDVDNCPCALWRYKRKVSEIPHTLAVESSTRQTWRKHSNL